MTKKAPKTSSHWLLWATVLVLVLLWAMATGLRYLASDSELATLGNNLWEIRIGVQITDPVTTGVVALAAVPADTDHLRIVGQHLTHPGWRLRFTSDPEWGVGRQTRLVSTNARTKGFELGFTVRQSDFALIQKPSLRRRLSAEALERNLRNEPQLDLDNDVVINEINRLVNHSKSNTDLLSRIFNRTRQLVLRHGASSRRVTPDILTSGQASVLERANTMVALCRAAHIPARLVTGLELTENRIAHLHHWVEAYISGKGWLAFDPLHGYQEELPANFLPFVKGRTDLVEVKSANKITINYVVTDADQSLAYYTDMETGWQSIFYLTRLPMETRNILAHLLLLPLAVLLTTLFRALTGVRSYGTFMPALFALALVYAEWQMAAITMCVVLLFGVLGRSAIPVKLSRQPRLTATLILVVLGVGASISLMEYLQWRHDGKVLLLPVVITAILADLFYKALENEGPLSAFMRLGWTLVQVIICLPLMQLDSLGHWLVAHPEAHLLTLAITLMITAYRGQKLVNLLNKGNKHPFP